MPTIGSQRGFKVEVQHRPVFIHHSDFAGLSGFGREGPLEEVVESRTVGLDELQVEPPSQQPPTRNAQQIGARKIHPADGAVAAEIKIADRRKIVEVGEALQSGFVFGLAPAQFLVLYLQLELVDFQFMAEAAPFDFALR